jgi:hypothetical protein
MAKAKAATQAPKARSGAGSEANGANGTQMMLAPDLGEVWHSLAGLGLPAAALAAAQRDYVEEAGAIWNRVLASAPPVLTDRRFAGADWSANPSSSFLAELYLLNARTLLHLARSVEGDAKTKGRIRFAVLQWIDAAAPSNYLALNPEAQKKAIDTKGESLMHGLAQLWNDTQRGHLSQTDESAFEVGRNVASSAGAVVFENEFFQLLEYTPLSAKVYERPMLFVPPCINKYYILDLQPENSLIRHTVAEGHRVFVMSWKNAGDDIAQRTWDDYIEHAVLRAIELVQEITGQKQINTLGFCIGGTILSTALAVLAARGERPAASMTLLTTFLDFSDTGILDIFIDETGVRMREQTIGAQSAGGGSLLKGQELATTFSFRRPNERVWKLLEGRDAAAVRPALLEQRRHQPARADVLLVPAQRLPREQPARAGQGHGLRRGARSRQHRHPELSLRLARGPHRSLAGRVPQHRDPEGQAPLRPRRFRPHRRRHQSAVEEKAQPLDRQDGNATGIGRRLACRRGRASGQLVERLVGLARAVRRQADRGAEEAGQCALEGDRAGARPLCEGKGLSTSLRSVIVIVIDRRHS